MRKPTDVRTARTALFSSIGIETAAVCNRRCYFCPNAEHERPDAFMPLRLFRKILDDLRSVRYAKRVELYIYNEPTRDERLPELIGLVRGALPRACVMINTNGDYLKSRAQLQRLFEAGLNQCQINVYAAGEKPGALPAAAARSMRAAEKRAATLQGWVDQLGLDQRASLYQYLPPPRMAARVVRKFGTHLPRLVNRSGNVPTFKPALPEPLAKGCTKPFRFLNINWKGEALLCCNDYHGETAVGNVADRHVVSLWNDPAFHAYRLRLQNQRRDQFLCDGCDFDGGPYQHNIRRVTFGPERDQQLLSADMGTFGKVAAAASRRLPCSQ